MAIKYTEINTDDIVFTQLRDNIHIPSQRVAYINRANESKLIIQTPEIITETYGIPQLGLFYNTDKLRAFYKLGFCHERKKYPEEVNYAAIEAFYNKLKELDAYFGSDDFKKKMFGSKFASKHEYIPIVHEIVDEEDDCEQDTNDTNKLISRAYKPPYVKLKIDLDYNTDCPKLKLYDKTNDSRNNVVVENFKDTTDHMKYLTKHRFIIHINRLYSMKCQGSSDKRKYAIGLKIIAVECTNKPQKLERSDVDFVDFID